MSVSQHYGLGGVGLGAVGPEAVAHVMTSLDVPVVLFAEQIPGLLDGPANPTPKQLGFSGLLLFRHMMGIAPGHA